VHCVPVFSGPVALDIFVCGIIDDGCAMDFLHDSVKPPSPSCHNKEFPGLAAAISWSSSLSPTESETFGFGRVIPKASLVCYSHPSATIVPFTAYNVCHSLGTSTLQEIGTRLQVHTHLPIALEDTKIWMHPTEENSFQSIPSKRHRLWGGVDHALKSEQLAEMVLIGPTEGTYVDICMSKFIELIDPWPLRHRSSPI
jgi:hypothetical protein